MLSALKRVGESFTEVIKRVVNEVKTRPLSSFSGTWRGSKSELDRIQKDIHDMWRRLQIKCPIF